MTHQLPAVQHALRVHTARATLTKEQKLNEAIALAEWGTFSNRQIAGFLALRPSLIHGITGKTDNRGGKLLPEALPLIAELIYMDARSERSRTAVVATLRAGVSNGMLARLTGLPESTISRWERAARDDQ